MISPEILTQAKKSQLVKEMATRMMKQFSQDQLNFYWNSLANIKSQQRGGMRELDKNKRKTEGDEKLGDYESEGRRLRGLINAFRFSMEEEVESECKKSGQKGSNDQIKLGEINRSRRMNDVKGPPVSRQIFETNLKMSKNVLRFKDKRVRLSQIVGEGQVKTIELPAFSRRIANLRLRSTQQSLNHESLGTRVPFDLMSTLRATQRLDKRGMLTKKVRAFGSKIE